MGRRSLLDQRGILGGRLPRVRAVASRLALSLDVPLQRACRRRFRAGRARLRRGHLRRGARRTPEPRVLRPRSRPSRLARPTPASAHVSQCAQDRADRVESAPNSVRNPRARLRACWPGHRLLAHPDASQHPARRALVPSSDSAAVRVFRKDRAVRRGLVAGDVPSPGKPALHVGPALADVHRPSPRTLRASGVRRLSGDDCGSPGRAAAHRAPQQPLALLGCHVSFPRALRLRLQPDHRRGSHRGVLGNTGPPGVVRHSAAARMDAVRARRSFRRRCRAHEILRAGRGGSAARRLFTARIAAVVAIIRKR